MEAVSVGCICAEKPPERYGSLGGTWNLACACSLGGSPSDFLSGGGESEASAHSGGSALSAIFLARANPRSFFVRDPLPSTSAAAAPSPAPKPAAASASEQQQQQQEQQDDDGNEGVPGRKGSAGGAPGAASRLPFWCPLQAYGLALTLKTLHAAACSGVSYPLMHMSNGPCCCRGLSGQGRGPAARRAAALRRRRAERRSGETRPRCQWTCAGVARPQR